MKVFLTGKTGQLGHDAYNELINRGHEIIAFDHDQLDITDNNLVNESILKAKPDAIIHCAAWTRVDDAEKLENREYVKLLNIDATKNIAEACKLIDAKMIYISTDYVFDGTGSSPWHPDNSNLSPLNYYGRSKMEGELAVSSVLDKFYIVRTSWLFGINGNNFVRKIIENSTSELKFKVINDQIGAPTYSVDLARLLVDMIETDKYGHYHATNEGEYISWYDFACEIFKNIGVNNHAEPISSADYGLCLAKRPLNSRLDTSKLALNGFKLLPTWQDALRRYLQELYS